MIVSLAIKVFKDIHILKIFFKLLKKKDILKHKVLELESLNQSIKKYAWHFALILIFICDTKKKNIQTLMLNGKQNSCSLRSPKWYSYR